MAGSFRGFRAVYYYNRIRKIEILKAGSIVEVILIPSFLALWIGILIIVVLSPVLSAFTEKYYNIKNSPGQCQDVTHTHFCKNEQYILCLHWEIQNSH